MQATQVQKTRKLSALARKAAEKASVGSNRLAPHAGPYHPASHTWYLTSCPMTADWGTTACGSLGWSTTCLPRLQLLAGNKRKEGRGCNNRDASGTCHGTWHPQPHSSCAHRAERECGRHRVRAILQVAWHLNSRLTPVPALI